MGLTYPTTLQPEADPKKVRVCSPFTVESDSRAVSVGTDEQLPAHPQESLTREQVIEALPVAGVKHGADHWTVTDLEPYPNSEIITYTAILSERKGKKILNSCGIHRS